MLRLAMILLLATTAHGAFYLENSGISPISYVDCQNYASPAAVSASDDATKPIGCYVNNGVVYYNKRNSAISNRVECTSTDQCVMSDSPRVATAQIVDTAVDPSRTIGLDDCHRAYSKLIYSSDALYRHVMNPSITITSGHNYPSGCISKTYGSSTTLMYNYDQDSTLKCNYVNSGWTGDQIFKCIEPDTDTLGCMNALASNYNAAATVDDGSCVTVDCPTCTCDYSSINCPDLRSLYSSGNCCYDSRTLTAMGV